MGESVFESFSDLAVRCLDVSKEVLSRFIIIIIVVVFYYF